MPAYIMSRRHGSGLWGSWGRCERLSFETSSIEEILDALSSHTLALRMRSRLRP